jgi:hypothetical protein
MFVWLPYFFGGSQIYRKVRHIVFLLRDVKVKTRQYGANPSFYPHGMIFHIGAHAKQNQKTYEHREIQPFE